MIVERTFGVWKKRFRILEDMIAYNFDTQRDIVLGTMAIHNYIRKKGIQDVAFTVAENENYIPNAQSMTLSDIQINDEVNQSDNYWMAVRDTIALDIGQSQ